MASLTPAMASRWHSGAMEATDGGFSGHREVIHALPTYPLTSLRYRLNDLELAASSTMIMATQRSRAARLGGVLAATTW